MTSFRATLCPIFQFFNKSDTLFDLSCTQMYSYKCDGTQTLDHTHRNFCLLQNPAIDQLSPSEKSVRTLVLFKLRVLRFCLVQELCRTNRAQNRAIVSYTLFLCAVQFRDLLHRHRKYLANFFKKWIFPSFGKDFSSTSPPPFGFQTLANTS